MHKISGQDYNIVTSTLVRNYNIIIHKILCSRQKILYSKFKFTIFCALSLNHLWAEIEKIHKISRQDYNIVTSTLVINYNIIIHKILCSSQNSIFKIQTYNIICIKSKLPLGRDRKKCIKFFGQNYNIAISTLVRNYNIIIYKISELKKRNSICLYINYPVGSN